MKIKRFFAKDMRTALTEVKEVFGPDAVIMSNKKVFGGVEIVAATDAMLNDEKKETHQNKSDSRQSAKEKVSISSKPNFAHLLDKYHALEKTNHERDNTKSATYQRQNLTANHLTKKEDLSYLSEQRKSDKNLNQKITHSPLTPDNSELQEMRNEMEFIRDLLEHQVSELLSQDLERKEPLRAMLLKRLTLMGISSNLAKKLINHIPESISPSQAWHDLLSILAKRLLTLHENTLEQGGVIALLGPTGVGKTTTIAKLAARAAMDFGANEIALVTTDTFRIGAHEQLNTYGNILGCTVKVAKDAQALTEILFELRHKKLVFIDTAGIGQRDFRLSKQLDTLMQNQNAKIKSFLVLSATSQTQVLEETIAHFRRIPIDGCILTKLDECLSLGEAITVMIEASLPLIYLADGQRVPEDIRQAEPSYLLQKASELLQRYRAKSSLAINEQIHHSNAADFYD